MNSVELTSALFAIANALACNLTDDELALLAATLVQLGDTLALISAQRSLCVNASDSMGQIKIVK